MQTSDGTCGMVPKTTTAWITNKTMPVACVSTVGSTNSGIGYDTCVLQRLVGVDPHIPGHAGHMAEELGEGCDLAVVFNELPVVLQALDHPRIPLQRAQLAGRPLRASRY